MPATPENYQLYTQFEREIETAITRVCRLFRLRGADADDFGQEARLHFLRNNCEVLARFRSECRPPTYFVVVLRNLLINLRHSEQGRYRPSRLAVQLGPGVVLLERLVIRDALPIDQAAEIAYPNGCEGHSSTSLSALLEQLRGRRRPGPAGLASSALPSLQAEGGRHRIEAVETARYVLLQFRESVSNLDSESQRLIERRFRWGRTVISLASEIGVSPRSLFGRFEKILRCLHKDLSQRISLSDVELAIGSGALEELLEDESSRAEFWSPQGYPH